jgi:hypothetical protein
MMAKLLMMIKCTLSAGPFDGHGGLPVQYEARCLMWYVQGYSGSHWMLPLGDYLLCIAPTATRATANKTTTKTCTHFAGHFDGRGGAHVQYHVHRPMEKVQGFTRSHWTLPLGKYYVQ